MTDDALFFETWIGHRYDCGFEPPRDDPNVMSFRSRLLILGESHYGSPDEYRRSFTRDLIENHAKKRSKATRSLTRAIMAVRGRTSTNFDPEWEWDRVAFANFVQEFKEDARIPPTAAEWARGRTAFRRILELTEPTFVVVLGRRLWKQLPRDWGVPMRMIWEEAEDVEIDEGWVYPVSKRCWSFVTYINHPAGRFDARKASLRTWLLQVQANADPALYPELNQ